MKNNISSVEYKNCYGCTACSNMCPHNAIKMDSNNFGFLQPVIDNSLCVECGLCRNVCPALNRWNADCSKDVQAYAAYSPQKEEREKSSSGAVFPEFAKIFEASCMIVGKSYPSAS